MNINFFALYTVQNTVKPWEKYFYLLFYILVLLCILGAGIWTMAGTASSWVKQMRAKKYRRKHNNMKLDEETVAESRENN